MPDSNSADSQLRLADHTIRPGKGGTIPGNEKFDAEADAAEAKTQRRLDRAAARLDKDTARRIG